MPQNPDNKEEKKEEKALPPFYHSTFDDKAFDHVIRDDNTKKLFDEIVENCYQYPGIKVRLATVSIFYNGKFYETSKVGLPSATSPAEIKLVRDHYGADNVVVAKKNQPGIVHEQTLNLKEAELKLTMENIPIELKEAIEKQHKDKRIDIDEAIHNFIVLQPKIGYSSYIWVDKQGKLHQEYTNRSAYNFSAFIRNPLPSTCFTFEKTEYDEICKNFSPVKWTLKYNTDRSIPVGPFHRLTYSANAESEIIITFDTNYKKSEKIWETICNIQDPEKRKKSIGDELMWTIYFAAGVEPSQSGMSLYVAEVTRAFEQANEHKIKLNLEAHHSSDKMTALLLAAKNGYTKIVKLLLDNKANINAINDQEMNALLLAVENGHTETVQLLLHNNANIDAKDSAGRSVLYLAAKSGNAAIVEILLKAGAHVETNVKSQSPLAVAAISGHKDVVKLFLDKESKDNDTQKNNAFHYAIKGHQSRLMDFLLNEYGVNINALDENNNTPLYTAVTTNHDETVHFLIKKEGVIVNETKRYDGDTPLLAAVRSNNEKITQYLLDAKADVNQANTKNKMTPLVHAVANNNLTLVKKLLEHKADVTHTTPSGRSPIHFAANKGNIEIMQALLEVDPTNSNLKENRLDGMTPLQIIIDNEDLALHRKIGAIKVLLDAKADPCQKKNDGISALRMAVDLTINQSDHSVLLELLLQSPQIDITECTAIISDLEKTLPPPVPEPSSPRLFGSASNTRDQQTAVETLIKTLKEFVKHKKALIS